jgi:phage gpG-like protein
MALSKFNISEVKKRLELTKRVVPIKLAKMTEKHFIGHFTDESFEGVKWQTPKRKIEGTNEYKYPKTKGLGRRTSSTLVRSGVLRRDVANSIKIETWNLIKLATSQLTEKYAKANNEGTNNIPARPFMKDSPQLRKKQLDLLNKEIDNIWK